VSSLALRHGQLKVSALGHTARFGLFFIDVGGMKLRSRPSRKNCTLATVAHTLRNHARVSFDPPKHSAVVERLCFVFCSCLAHIPVVFRFVSA
jgi:hypothetical protein